MAGVVWLVLWLAWVAYCVPVVPTWCYVWLGLRPQHGRLVSWAAASGLSVVWWLFVPQHRRWLRERAKPVSVADEAQSYLATIK